MTAHLCHLMRTGQKPFDLVNRYKRQDEISFYWKLSLSEDTTIDLRAGHHKHNTNKLLQHTNERLMKYQR